MLRIAVVGAGLIGRQHIELVRREESCTLVAVVDPAPAARELSRDLGVAWHPSVADLLERERPDGVIIATPSAMHRDHAIACIRAGVPVLIEKPIATTSAAAGEIASLADEMGVAVLVGHHRRHSPSLAAARRVIDEGRLGRIVAVTGAAMFRKPDRYFLEAPWRREPGGGPLLINMIHEVDALRYLCGEITSVQAVASASARGFEVEDTVAITMTFASGALGTFLLSDTAATPISWELTSGENPAYPVHPGVDCYVIAGETGWLGVPTLRLATYAGTPSWWEPLVAQTVPRDDGDPLARQLAHFCDVIRGRATPLVTASGGAQNVRLIEAISEGIRSGAPVTISREGVAPDSP